MDDPIAYWNGPAGDRWVAEQAGLDAMLRPFGAAVLEAAHVGPGESVLDVGCGCGDSSLALATLVGSAGRVLGLDVSRPMLALARARSASLPNVALVEGDASTAPLPAAAFDVLFSRFGVMFFPEPTGAFRHLRASLRPRGRVAFVAWRPLAENPWAKVPFDAVADALGRPDPEPADAPGPFSFGDPARIRGILEGAGFRDVAARAFDTPMIFGASATLDEAVAEVARLGPVARLLVNRDETARRRALQAIRAVMTGFANARGGYCLPAATWIVTAANGA